MTLACSRAWYCVLWLLRRPAKCYATCIIYYASLTKIRKYACAPSRHTNCPNSYQKHFDSICSFASSLKGDRSDWIWPLQMSIHCAGTAWGVHLGGVCYPLIYKTHCKSMVLWERNSTSSNVSELICFRSAQSTDMLAVSASPLRREQNRVISHCVLTSLGNSSKWD